MRCQERLYRRLIVDPDAPGVCVNESATDYAARQLIETLLLDRKQIVNSDLGGPGNVFQCYPPPLAFPP
jgi:hypothetical protein